MALVLGGIRKQALRTMEDGDLGLTVQPSKVKHKNAGSWFFAERSFTENVFVGFYYGAFDYGN